MVHEQVTDHTQTPAAESAKSYVWGLDLSQTLQGAGGVGGLLQTTINDDVSAIAYFATADGNGNIMALVDASDGSVDAEYDYSPFGTTIKATGTAADTNTFRFSTKYHDTETKLVDRGQALTFDFLRATLVSWLVLYGLNMQVRYTT